MKVGLVRHLILKNSAAIAANGFNCRKTSHKNLAGTQTRPLSDYAAGSSKAKFVRMEFAHAPPTNGLLWPREWTLQDITPKVSNSREV